MIIANCGALGLDWNVTSMSGYLEALEAHNEANAPPTGSKATPEQLDRLRRMMKARADG
jgi:hypothetical protein